MVECDLEDPGVDPIYGIQNIISKDSRDVINLTVGVYVPKKGGKPPVISAIKLAEKKLLEEEKTKSYLPISGDNDFLNLTAQLIFDKFDKNKICMVQSVGGTSALSTGFSFLKKNGITDVSVSNPTWANHMTILENFQFTIHRYHHMKAVRDFSVLISHLEGLAKNTIILLQPTCHNPTGIDFSKSEWEAIAEICIKRELIPFFDNAYQGFAHSLQEDAWPIRHFYEKGLDMFVAHSFSKSFSLYNERVGALFFVTKNVKQKDKMQRILNRLIRVNYSNPPNHGSSCIKIILQDEALKRAWLEELMKQRNRMVATRKKFAGNLDNVFDESIIKELSTGNGFFLPNTIKKRGN